MNLLNSRQVANARKIKLDNETKQLNKIRRNLEKDIEAFDNIKKSKKSIDDSESRRYLDEINMIKQNLFGYRAKRNTLLREIQDLEEEKEKAMIPLYEKETEIYAKMEEYNEIGKTVRKLKKEYESKVLEINSKQEKIDKNVEETEISLAKVKKSKEKAVNYEQETKKILKSNLEKSYKLDEREKIIEEKEKSIVEQRNALSISFESLARKEESINKKAKLIESRQAQLKTALQELKKYEY